MILAQGVSGIVEMQLAGRVSLGGIVDLYRVGGKWYYYMRYPK
jgi:hypothetical protein